MILWLMNLDFAGGIATAEVIGPLIDGGLINAGPISDGMLGA